MTHPDQLTDGTGNVWKLTHNPPPADRLGRILSTRNGQPLYYSTGTEDWALTPDEIRAQYGLR
ncbi:hypothetical protein AB0K23_01480 [Streptomyces sp. NPDC049602]|jgi:hypothetical protein|uniref:hypothetical protein n=1 Tax=Streptomyces sp. NPDC049602 TaxID=3155504 RepID=UPI00341F98F6